MIHRPDDLHATIEAHELADRARHVPEWLARASMHRGGGRRFGGAGIRRGVRVPGGSGGVDPLLRMSDLTFARASSAAFQDPRDGWAFVGAQKGVDEPRIFDDGAILIEGERTNLVPNSANFDDPPWDHLNSPVVTTDAATAPDGTDSANLIAYAAGGADGQIRDLLADTDFTDGEKSALTVWLQGDGADELRLYFRDKASANELLETYSPAASFEKVTRIVDNGTGTTDPLIGLLEETDGADFHVWGFQLEADAAYPSTYIATDGGTETRAIDLAEASSWPTQMLEGRWSFDWWPMFSSSEISGTRAFFVFDSTTERLDLNGGRIRAVSSGMQAQSNVLTWSRYQKMTVTIDCAAGTIEVSGATTGDGVGSGSAWTWTSGSTRRVGWYTGDVMIDSVISDVRSA